MVGGNGHQRLSVERVGWEQLAAPSQRLAIVGSHPATRELAPYDDPRYEIWLFNEAPQKPAVYRRWDVDFQMHLPEVYASLENWVNKDHWAWLQQDHGPGKKIYMIARDERVPNSIAYPLEAVLALIPYRYLRSTPAQALALAILQGYQHIELYGSELTSNTEYSYQATNYAFWIGFAHGRGIDLQLKCWQSEFDQPIYGYEGEFQLSAELYQERLRLHNGDYRRLKAAMDKIESRMDRAMIDSDYAQVGELSLTLAELALKTGEHFGAQSEAERYMQRTNQVSRQEFERVSAQAQRDGLAKREGMLHCGGKAEYVWNVWRQSGRLEALQQLRAFLREKTQLAYETGRQEGIYRENLHYMAEFDARLLAAGGVRALSQVRV